MRLRKRVGSRNIYKDKVMGAMADFISQRENCPMMVKKLKFRGKVVWPCDSEGFKSCSLSTVKKKNCWILYFYEVVRWQ